MGGKASWSWVSIMKGRDVLVHEGLWVIGDGADIQAATDPWLPTKRDFRIEPTQTWEDNQEMKVSSLIDNSTGTWNENLIFQLATPGDISHVLNLHLPVQGTHDRILWPYTDHGNVMVKTNYHSLKEAEEMRPPSLNTLRSTTIWSAVWKTKTLPKIKTFIWRMLANSLPVMANLRRRGMLVMQGWRMCGMTEDVEHMLFRCNGTKPLWFSGLGLGEQQHERDVVGAWLQDRREEHNGERQGLEVNGDSA